jgi:hypothetical protein
MTAALVPAEVQASIAERVAIAGRLKDAAATMTIANATEAKLANEFVSRAAGHLRENEKARKAATQPLVEEKRALDEAFKQPVALLQEADQLVRRLLIDWQTEQDRLRREQEAAAAAERARQEEEARQRRQAAQDEADRVAREAEEAEMRRQAEIAAAQDGLRQRVAAFSDDELQTASVASSTDPDLRDAVNEEIDARDRQRQALARAEAAQAEADAAALAEIGTSTEIIEAPWAPGPLRSASGSSSTTKRWTATVTDLPALVQAWLAGEAPAEFVIADESAIGKYIRSTKADHAEHPGITYEQVSGLAVRTTR